MTDLPKCRCGHPIHDMAYVCGRCADGVRHELAEVVKVAGAITLTVAKLDRLGEGGPRADPEPPLPVNLSAATAHDAAVGELSTWARHVAEVRGGDVEGNGHPLALLALWLTGQVDWLRHRQEAEEALDAITDACRALVRVVDRRAERWYAGRCDSCQTDLYPVAGAKTIRCPECPAEYDADQRKVKLLRDLEDVWATPEQCAHAMTSLGLPVNASTIRTWGAQRHRLAPHPESLPGRPRYRVGSVRELVEQMHAEQRERTLRAAVKAAEAADRKAKKERISA